MLYCGLVGDDPLQGVFDVAEGAGAVGVEHLQGDEVDVGSDAGVGGVGAADDAGDVGAVAVVVHRVGVVVDEVPAGDDAFAPKPPPRAGLL